jgi:hypothetical protein
MWTARLLVVCSFAAISAGCDQNVDSYDGDLEQRSGTTGSGTSSSTGTGSSSTSTSTSSSTSSTSSTSGSDGASDGASDGEPESDGGSSGPTEPDGSEECQIYGKSQPDNSRPPYKEGQYWVQGSWSACAYIALINANIDAGANDTDGVFEKRVRDCLKDVGITDAHIADGLIPSEIDAIADCKEDAMEHDGEDVDIECEDLYGFWDLDNYCDELEEALDNGGSATVSFTDGIEGHALTVVDVECSGDITTLHLKDPNFPNGDTYVVTADEDEVTSVSPPHFFLKTGLTATRVCIETHDD